MKTIDCRNMPCPAPVITAKKALESSLSEEIELLVDEGAARENVTRFAVARGCSVEEKQLDKGFSLWITKGADTVLPLKAVVTLSGETVILITSDRLGDGPEELGKLLMKNFIITLLELPVPPDTLIFLNSGIHLTTEGSELLEPLKKLENAGVTILSCGLCLDFFHKKEKLGAGTVTNMVTTGESLLSARSVIKL